MNIKIIVAAHKKYRMPADQCYLPLHVGKKGKADLGYQGDDAGDNISEKNPYYCELTGLYWAWKNLDADYIGLAHYRRHFANRIRKMMFWKKDPFDAVLTEKEIRKLLKKSDIILPAKRHYYIENLYSHYAHTHYEEHLILTRKIIEQRTPEYLSAYDQVMKQTSGHMFNMFIMKKEAFDSYCNFMFGVLEKLENEIDISDYSAQEARVFGYISELLMDVWLYTTKESYKEISWGRIGPKQLVKKTISFVNRKFGIGKKQTHF